MVDNILLHKLDLSVFTFTFAQISDNDMLFELHFNTEYHNTSDGWRNLLLHRTITWKWILLRHLCICICFYSSHHRAFSLHHCIWQCDGQSYNNVFHLSRFWYLTLSAFSHRMAISRYNQFTKKTNTTYWNRKTEFHRNYLFYFLVTPEMCLWIIQANINCC